MERLARTQLCFSCAHGRPTTMAAVDLQLLDAALQLRAQARLVRAACDDGGGEEGPAAAAGEQQGLAGLRARLQRFVAPSQA